ncbi:MAG: histidine phosphatase family protein [Solirubrobacteraceae bacterium]
MAVTLLLARHGETIDNANGLILGRRNPPLSNVGWEQSARLAIHAQAAGVTRIWCSPLRRARQTAAVVGEAIGLEPTVLDELIESDRGTWEGEPVSRIAVVSPELHAAFENADPDFAFPRGESIRAQVERTRKALTLVAAEPGPALVVAHAGTIRAAMIATGLEAPPERDLPHGETIPLAWPVNHGPAS